MINLNLKNTGITNEELNNIKTQTQAVFNTLAEKSGAGNDFLGWIDHPINYDKEEFDRILKAAEKIKKQSQVLVAIGIGGSYLGARAGIEFTKGQFANSLATKDGNVEVYFVGSNISSTYASQIINVIGDRDFSINVISKSGTTTEPAVAFRIFKQLLEEKYSKDEAKERIYATTDANKGALHDLAIAEGYERFVVPDDIGGRFSCLTAVGLLPMAAAGMDIQKVMEGCAAAREKYKVNNFENNDAMQYAAARNILLRQGKTTEIYANYEPSLTMFGEWLKQLMAESEGKDKKGIFPVSANFSTDLHSIGQYIQDGMRNLFETVIWVDHEQVELKVPFDEENVDGLNFAAEKTMQFMNKQAMRGTLLAHVDGGVPNIVINVDECSDYTFGELCYFFWWSLGISGYILGVNPFNQPGVEAYKKNMFALLGKPGYEDMREELENRLSTVE